MTAAGVEPASVYITNAVKHFKWEAGGRKGAGAGGAGERGKRRMHKKPLWTEVVACRPWLLAELEVVRPRLVVCLGATAAQSLLGHAFRLTKHRGEVLSPGGGYEVLATVHPSSLLRMPDETARHAAKRQFLDDLRQAAERVRKPRADDDR